MKISFAGTTVSGYRADSSGNFNWHASGGQGHQFYQSITTGTSVAGIAGLGIILGGGAGATASNAPVEIANAHATTSDGIKLTKAALQRIAKSGGQFTLGTVDAQSLSLMTNNVARADKKGVPLCQRRPWRSWSAHFPD